MKRRAEGGNALRPDDTPRALPGVYPMRTMGPGEGYGIGRVKGTIEYAPGRIPIDTGSIQSSRTSKSNKSLDH